MARTNTPNYIISLRYYGNWLVKNDEATEKLYCDCCYQSIRRDYELTKRNWYCHSCAFIYNNNM